MTSHDWGSCGVPDWKAIAIASFRLHFAELLPGGSPQTVRRPSTASIGRLQSSVFTIKYYRISFQWPYQISCLEFRPRFTSEVQKNNSDLDQHRLPPPAHEFEVISKLYRVRTVGCSKSDCCRQRRNHHHQRYDHTFDGIQKAFSQIIRSFNLSQTWF
jgi:hypothetical protein